MIGRRAFLALGLTTVIAPAVGCADESGTGSTLGIVVQKWSGQKTPNVLESREYTMPAEPGAELVVPGLDDPTVRITHAGADGVQFTTSHSLAVNGSDDPADHQTDFAMKWRESMTCETPSEDVGYRYTFTANP